MLQILGRNSTRWYYMLFCLIYSHVLLYFYCLTVCLTLIAQRTKLWYSCKHFCPNPGNLARNPALNTVGEPQKWEGPQEFTLIHFILFMGKTEAQKGSVDSHHRSQLREKSLRFLMCLSVALKQQVELDKTLTLSSDFHILYLDLRIWYHIMEGNAKPRI